MKAHHTFADAIVQALKDTTITDVKLDVSDRGVIHELVLTVDKTNIYFLPLEGKLVVEFEYKGVK